MSVEMTVSLLEALRSDELPSSKALRSVGVPLEQPLVAKSEGERRALYAMTITRLINGLTASYQTGPYNKSIQSLARVLELPDGLVELRHSAAHGEIPSLVRLRTAALQSLQWLHDRYWLRQSTYFETTKTTTTGLLTKLAKLRKQLTSENAASRPDFAVLKKESTDTTSKLLTELTSSQILVCLIPALLDLPILVPTQLKLSKMTAKYTEVPRRLEEMWMDIIAKFTKRWPCFLPAFVVAIVTRLFNTTQLLPKYNVSAPARMDPNQERAIKYSIALLRCWIELLLKRFFVPSFSKDVVDAATEAALMDESSGTGDGDKKQAETASDVGESKRKKRKNAAESAPKNAKTSKAVVLDNDAFPHRPILFMCFHFMNKQSIKLIKLTLCYMSDEGERDRILPKLKTLFHFRSRALNLSRADHAHASGESIDRIKELQRRADTNAEHYGTNASAMNLEDFVSLIAASPSPAQLKTTHTTMFGMSDSPQNTPSANTPQPQSDTTRTGNRPLQPTPLSDPAGISSGAFTDYDNPDVRAALWTPVEGTFPVIGMSPEGNAPGDLSLPLHLDHYQGAIFLVPASSPAISSLSMHAQPGATPPNDPSCGHTSTSKHRQATTPPSSVKRAEPDHPSDLIDGDTESVQMPEAKRFCPATDAEVSADLPSTIFAPSSAVPAPSTTPKPKIDLKSEKSKIQLMIKPGAKRKK